MYISFEEYKGEFGGLITDETTFKSFCAKAASKLNYATFSRLTKMDVISVTVKSTMQEIIDTLYSESLKSKTEDGKVIAGYSNSGLSVSFEKSKTSEELDKTIFNTININLFDEKDSQGRRILYRGKYKGE